MNYKVAVYSNDYMLLLELVSRIDSELPMLEVMVFGSKKLEESLAENAAGYIIEDIGRMKEADILILLSKPDEAHNVITKFDGSIIDITGYVFPEGAEVFRVTEPIASVFENLDAAVSNLSAVVQIPACVFGKDGIEDLMEQTRDIFSFGSRDSLVFTERLAFNIHFEPTGLINTTAGKTVSALTAEGADISVRLVPLSTVFTIDVFSSDGMRLNNTEGYLEPTGFFTAENVPENEILTMKKKNGYSFAGDYLRVYIAGIVAKLKEVMG